MKIKWRVSPKPTGRYRSFEYRGWPVAEYEDGSICAQVLSEEEYTQNPTKPLTLKVADYSKIPFGWIKCVHKSKDMNEVRALLEAILNKYPYIRKVYRND